jgi:filamentous hemagglutinin
VEVEGLTGNGKIDQALACAAVGLANTPEGYVWHHVEDAVTMQLVRW